MRKLLLTSLLFFFLFDSVSQDSLVGKNEFGIGLNRFVPVLKNETNPFRFSLEYRRRWKETEKYQHFIAIRGLGNYNSNAGFKPISTKTYIGFELGHWSRRTKEDTRWHLSWGASLGYYQTIQKINPLDKNPYDLIQPESFSRSIYRLGVSPKFGVEYAFSERFFAQLIMAVGFATKYYGSVDHLESNGAGTFSAQFPAISVHYVF